MLTKFLNLLFVSSDSYLKQQLNLFFSDKSLIDINLSFADDLYSANKVLETSKTDLILLDVLALSESQHKIFSFITIRKNTHPVIVLINDKQDYDLVDELRNCGACDFLEKLKLDFDSIFRSITYAMEGYKKDKEIKSLKLIIEDTEDAKVSKLIDENSRIIHECERIKLREYKLFLEYKQERFLNGLLVDSLKSVSLAGLLEGMIDKIVDEPWIAVEASGAIFLKEDDPNKFVLKAQKDLHQELIDKYSVIDIVENNLAKRAIVGNVLYVNIRDDDNILKSLNLEITGYYCVPIKSTNINDLQGFLLLFSKNNILKDPMIERFFVYLGHILSLVIQRRKMELVLQEANQTLLKKEKILKQKLNDK